MAGLSSWHSESSINSSSNDDETWSTVENGARRNDDETWSTVENGARRNDDETWSTAENSARRNDENWFTPIDDNDYDKLLSAAENSLRYRRSMMFDNTDYNDRISPAIKNSLRQYKTQLAASANGSRRNDDETRSTTKNSSRRNDEKWFTPIDDTNYDELLSAAENSLRYRGSFYGIANFRFRELFDDTDYNDRISSAIKNSLRQYKKTSRRNDDETETRSTAKNGSCRDETQPTPIDDNGYDELLPAAKKRSSRQGASRARSATGDLSEKPPRQRASDRSQHDKPVVTTLSPSTAAAYVAAASAAGGDSAPPPYTRNKTKPLSSSLCYDDEAASKPFEKKKKAAVLGMKQCTYCIRSFPGSYELGTLPSTSLASRKADCAKDDDGNVAREKNAVTPSSNSDAKNKERINTMFFVNTRYFDSRIIVSFGDGEPDYIFERSDEYPQNVDSLMLRDYLTRLNRCVRRIYKELVDPLKNLIYQAQLEATIQARKTYA